MRELGGWLEGVAGVGDRGIFKRVVYTTLQVGRSPLMLKNATVAVNPEPCVGEQGVFGFQGSIDLGLRIPPQVFGARSSLGFGLRQIALHPGPKP